MINLSNKWIHNYLKALLLSTTPRCWLSSSEPKTFWSGEDLKSAKVKKKVSLLKKRLIFWFSGWLLLVPILSGWSPDSTLALRSPFYHTKFLSNFKQIKCLSDSTLAQRFSIYFQLIFIENWYYSLRTNLKQIKYLPDLTLQQRFSIHFQLIFIENWY